MSMVHCSWCLSALIMTAHQMVQLQLRCADSPSLGGLQSYSAELHVQQPR
eukprot:SAG11_NODE_3083_length_2706_cov_6.647104_3_plen_50_part_00